MQKHVALLLTPLAALDPPDSGSRAGSACKPVNLSGDRSEGEMLRCHSAATSRVKGDERFHRRQHLSRGMNISEDERDLPNLTAEEGLVEKEREASRCERRNWEMKLCDFPAMLAVWDGSGLRGEGRHLNPLITQQRLQCDLCRCAVKPRPGPAQRRGWPIVFYTDLRIFREARAGINEGSTKRRTSCRAHVRANVMAASHCHVHGGSSEAALRKCHRLKVKRKELL